jgi:transposase
MRGSDAMTGSLFSYVDIEARIPTTPPIRTIRRIVNTVLTVLDGEFAAMYSVIGRPSITPERLLRGSLLQIIFSVRSERQLMEQLDYNLMFRWFVGFGIEDPVWDHSVYSKNRDRLLQADIARKFLKGILEHAEITSPSTAPSLPLGLPLKASCRERALGTCSHPPMIRRGKPKEKLGPAGTKPFGAPPQTRRSKPRRHADEDPWDR